MIFNAQTEKFLQKIGAMAERLVHTGLKKGIGWHFPGHTEREIPQKGRGAHAPSPGAGVIRRVSLRLRSAVVPPVLALLQPRLCSPGGGAKHRPAGTPGAAGQLLRLQRPPAHGYGLPLAGSLPAGAGELHPPLHVGRNSRAGAAVSKAECGAALSAGRRAGCFCAGGAELCRAPAVW